MTEELQKGQSLLTPQLHSELSKRHYFVARRKRVIIIVTFTELFRLHLNFAVLERMSSYLSQIFLPTIPRIPLITYY